MCYFWRATGIILMVCLLVGGVVQERNVTTSSCFLCAYQGQQGNERLGVLLVSARRIMEITLPEYEPLDTDIEDTQTSSFSMSMGKAAQGLNRVTIVVRAKEGRARISAEIDKKIKPDKTALQKQYCQACMSKMKNVRTDMLLVDLKTRQTYPVDRSGSIRIREYEIESHTQEGRAVMEIYYRAT